MIVKFTDRFQQQRILIINTLCQWSKDWQMVFNVNKCKVLHIGHNNAYCDYSMNGEGLESVTEESDFGIIVSNDLNPSNNVLVQLRKPI